MEDKTMKNVIIKNLIIAALFMWALISMFLLLGEESTEQPISLTRYVAYKVIGAILLYGLYRVAKALHKNGMLDFPKITED